VEDGGGGRGEVSGECLSFFFPSSSNRNRRVYPVAVKRGLKVTAI